METQQETVPEGGGPSKRQSPKIEEGTHPTLSTSQLPSVAGVGEAGRGARGPLEACPVHT